MPLATLVQVALLAVLSSLIVRKFGEHIPPRLRPLLPIVFALFIYWFFVAEAGMPAGVVATRGFVSGLLAGGILYAMLGIAGRLER